MTAFKLLKKLERAHKVCEPCGAEYGERNPELYLLNNGTCDVCNDETLVSNTSNWGYLRKGRLEVFSYVTEKMGLDVQPHHL